MTPDPARLRLLEALKGLYALIEDGTLVRNIADDDKPGWTMKALKLTMALKAAHDAIDAAQGKEGE